MPFTPTLLDRIALQISPHWAVRRMRARIAAGMLARYYDGASSGRRTEGWRKVSGDGNAAAQRGLSTRDTARDLVRNNPWARAAVSAIVDRVVGWGITPTVPAGAFGEAWTAWAETTACDADGRRTLHGLARQTAETVVTAGECLIRRRIRRPEDNLPIPLQLQILEPDYLDEMLDRNLPNGGAIIQGVEFSPIGAPVAYWLFPEHPGASRVGVRGVISGESQRIPASEMLHVCLPDRPGQVRGVSWFAPIMLRLKDLDDYEDAALMKQKIAACLAVILTDSSGAGTPLGTADDSVTPGVDSLQPGLIARFTAGDSVEVVQPPSVSEHGPYTKTVLQGIATGMGISYEELTGDYGNLPFSAARMSRIRGQARVEAWRWDMMIPQFYAGIWSWAVQLAPSGPYAAQAVLPKGYVPEWTPPPLPMLDPGQEGLAYIRNIRGGLQSLSDVHRELGYDPKRAIKEMADDWKAIDTAKLILDSDPRKTTQAGILQGEAGPPLAPPPAESATVTESASRSSVERLERMVEGLMIASKTPQNGHAPAPITVNVDAAMREGAIHMAAPPAQAPPTMTIDARTRVEPSTVNVTPAPVHVDARTSMNVDKDAIRFRFDPPDPPPAPSVTIGPDAIRVHVEAPPAPPPAQVHVASPVTIAEGAVQVAHTVHVPERAVQVDVAAPPPAQVHIDAPVTVQPTEVHVAAPIVHVAAPPPPTPMRHVVESRDADGNVESIRDEPLADEQPSQ